MLFTYPTARPGDVKNDEDDRREPFWRPRRPSFSTVLDRIEPPKGGPKPPVAAASTGAAIAILSRALLIAVEEQTDPARLEG